MVPPSNEEALIDTMCKKVGGAVSISYSPEGILSCLKLASHLKPSSSLQDVLIDAAELLLPPGPSKDAITAKEHQLPSLGLLRAARVR